MRLTGWMPPVDASAIFLLVLYFFTGTSPFSECFTETPRILPFSTSTEAVFLPFLCSSCLPFCLILSPSRSLPLWCLCCLAFFSLPPLVSLCSCLSLPPPLSFGCANTVAPVKARPSTASNAAMKRSVRIMGPPNAWALGGGTQKNAPRSAGRMVSTTLTELVTGAISAIGDDHHSCDSQKRA